MGDRDVRFELMDVAPSHPLESSKSCRSGFFLEANIAQAGNFEEFFFSNSIQR